MRLHGEVSHSKAPKEPNFDSLPLTDSQHNVPTHNSPPESEALPSILNQMCFKWLSMMPPHYKENNTMTLLPLQTEAFALVLYFQSF